MINSTIGHLLRVKDGRTILPLTSAIIGDPTTRSRLMDLIEDGGMTPGERDAKRLLIYTNSPFFSKNAVREELTNIFLKATLVNIKGHFINIKVENRVNKTS